MNVYETCPTLENNTFIIRRIEQQDALDLLEVYRDLFALPFFNSDNCHGSNFYITNLADMQSTIKYWLIEYFENKGFVRFTIVDKVSHKGIGTIEMFHRIAEDTYNHCGVLRIDLKSEFEKSSSLYEILSLIIEPFYDWFSCDKIITKAACYAVERIEALKQAGFTQGKEPLVGHDRLYYDYWVISK